MTGREGVMVWECLSLRLDASLPCSQPRPAQLPIFLTPSTRPRVDSANILLRLRPIESLKSASDAVG